MARWSKLTRTDFNRSTQKIEFNFHETYIDWARGRFAACILLIWMLLELSCRLYACSFDASCIFGKEADTHSAAAKFEVASGWKKNHTNIQY